MVPLIDTTGRSIPTRQVSISWISESFQLFIARPGIWIAALVIGFVLPYIFIFAALYAIGYPITPTTAGPGAASAFFHGVNFIKFGFIEIIGGLLILFFLACQLRMAIKQVRGLPLDFGDIFSGGRVYWNLFGYNLLYNLIGIALEVICFLPFLIVMALHPFAGLGTGGVPNLFNGAAAADPLWLGVGIVLVFASFVVLFGLLLPAQALIADGERILPAMQRSFDAMKSQWLPAVGLILLAGVLVIASEIPCGLGLLVTVPMMILMLALAYRDMIGMPGMMIPLQPNYGYPQAGVWPPPPGEGPPSYPTDPRF